MTILQAESATTICQRALGWAEHRNTFDSLEDNSTLAREARLRYDARRRAVLEALDWGFARHRVVGQSLANQATPFDLPRAWSLPPECLRIRAVLQEGTALRWRREAVVFSVEAPAVQIVFTADMHDPAGFPPVFTQALEFLLASEFSMVYARSVNRADVMLQNFRRTMMEADELEAGERGPGDQAYAAGGWVDAIESPWMDLR